MPQHGKNGPNGAHGPTGGNGGEIATTPAAELAAPKLPESWNRSLIDSILERMASGTSLRSCCRDSRISEATFRRWVIQNHDGLSAQYAHARELQMEAWADEIKELSDVCEIGTRREIMPDGGVKIIEGDMIERAKLRIDARKWLMSKIAPKKYGDRTDTSVNVGVGGTGTPIVVEINPFRGHRELMAERVPLNGGNGNGDGDDG